MKKVGKSILKQVYKPRPSQSKKYDAGILIVIGGSEFYSGSPALSAFAAFRAGVDMVHIVAPKRAADIIASFSPLLAAYPLMGDWLTKKHLAALITLTESAKSVSGGKAAVVIGGGLGRTKETQETILEYLSKISAPAVLDADALHAAAKDPAVVSERPFVLTPHSYEFFLLSGQKITDFSEEKKAEMVKEEARRLKTTILLKGEKDIISQGEEVALNETGNPFMTVGGTGDTLAGILGALLARGKDRFSAAQAAAYINGRAGELASKEKGESLTPIDLIEAIPKVLLKNF